MAGDCFPWGFLKETVYTFNVSSAGGKQQCPKLALWLAGRKELLYDWTLCLLRSSWDLQVDHKSLWHCQLLLAGLLPLLGLKLLLGYSLSPLLEGPKAGPRRDFTSSETWIFFCEQALPSQTHSRGNLNTIWKENLEIFPLMCSTGILLLAHSFSSLQAGQAFVRMAGCSWTLVLGHMRWRSPMEKFRPLPLG